MDILTIAAIVILLAIGFNFYTKKTAKKSIGKEIDFNQLPADFANKIKNKFLILFFTSDSCSNCKIQERLFDEMEGIRNHLLYIDTKSDHELVNYFGIKGTPTLITVKNNKIIDNLVGVQNKTVLERYLDEN
ncbi:MAG: thioredoxin [Bacteroidetes bacterium]|nr:MAG: thioredoxin [Bacteroidota bacterium]